jgi:hypothetical protein
MPRTKSQAKRKTLAPATTPAQAKTTPSTTARRQAPRASAKSGRDIHQSPPSLVPSAASPEALPVHETLLPAPPEASYSLPAPPGADEPEGVPRRRSPPAALSPALAEELTALWPDLQALAHWWHERQRLAQQDETPDCQLVRQTYHIEQRYIDAVKREADRTGESYAAVVNRAFARYFAGR